MRLMMCWYNQLTRNTIIEQKGKIILIKMENTILDIKYLSQLKESLRKLKTNRFWT